MRLKQERERPQPIRTIGRELSRSCFRNSRHRLRAAISIPVYEETGSAQRRSDEHRAPALGFTVQLSCGSAIAAQYPTPAQNAAKKYASFFDFLEELLLAEHELRRARAREKFGGRTEARPDFNASEACFTRHCRLPCPRSILTLYAASALWQPNFIGF